MILCGYKNPRDISTPQRYNFFPFLQIFSQKNFHSPLTTNHWLLTSDNWSLIFLIYRIRSCRFFSLNLSRWLPWLFLLRKACTLIPIALAQPLAPISSASMIRSISWVIWSVSIAVVLQMQQKTKQPQGLCSLLFPVQRVLLKKYFSIILKRHSYRKN